MNYSDRFQLEFVQRTLQIVDEYDQQFEATLLINCLLGLLVVPKEDFLEHIPETSIKDLENWGIDARSIDSIGNTSLGCSQTLRGVVINLRHAVAHFNVEPIAGNDSIKGFRFSNQSGFRASIELDNLRIFVKAVADCIICAVREPR